jgi:hypothetical protein
LFNTRRNNKAAPTMKRRRTDAVSPDEKHKFRFNPVVALPFDMNMVVMSFCELREMGRLQRCSKAYKPLVIAYLKQATSITTPIASEQFCQWMLEHCTRLKRLTFERPWSSSHKPRWAAKLIMKHAGTLREVCGGITNSTVLCALSHCSELKTLNFADGRRGCNSADGRRGCNSSCLALLLDRVKGIETVDLGKLPAKQGVQILNTNGK